MTKRVGIHQQLSVDPENPILKSDKKTNPYGTDATPERMSLPSIGIIVIAWILVLTQETCNPSGSKISKSKII